jgi:tripartite-type tricarboxylate transporter receptor subunit TctC
MFAPAGTPAAIISVLNAEAKRAFQAPEVVRRMTAEGTDIVVNSPPAFAIEVKTEFQKWRELVRKTGMKF